ncbi:MAG: WG repeat-containing protein [Lewinellaceae bacterium]|nr:WG repeat-containing protein [Lewinellaceae bacterium]
MKTTPILFLLLALSVLRAAAQPCTTFDCAMQQAKAAYEAKDYRKAYEGFKAAKNFKRAKTAEVNAWLDKTFDALEKQQKVDAENARQAEAGQQKATKALERLYFYKGRFGLAYDEINSRFGFVDKNGNTTIPFKYNRLWPFDEQGFARGVVKGFSTRDSYF